MNAVQDQIQSLIKEVESQYSMSSGHPAENTTTTHKIVKVLQEHQKLERTSGAQVSPAMRQPKASSLFERAEQCELRHEVLWF